MLARMRRRGSTVTAATALRSEGEPTNPGASAGGTPLVARRLLGLAVATMLLTSVLPRPLRAQSPNPNSPMSRGERVRALQQRTWDVQASRVQGAIRVDGRLNEADWQRAEPISDFFQRERNEGLPGTERTEVRVLYDDETLYVGFRCYDSHPELMKVRSIFRDETGGGDDSVSVLVDAFHDHRSAIQFLSNANGLMEDMAQNGENEQTRNRNFDTVWLARGNRTENGYEVEFAIPFKSLRFNPPAGGQDVTFGIGFKRNIPRKNEEVYWPFVANDSTWYRPAELGHLRGLREIRPGRNVQLRPYVLGGSTRDVAEGVSGGRREAGLDVKWGVTPGLTADFTLNTDFAQEEVDVQQINFTRFSLFFPEKRQFFLEGEQMFRFGVPREADLVFTRRIGLSGQGEAIPILSGTRLSGRQGRTSLGAMNIQTDAARGLRSENFTVLRVRRDLFARSSAGALLTNRQGGGTVNRVYGADASFFFKQVWFLEGFLASMDDGEHRKGTSAGYGRFSFDTDRYGATLSHLDLGENFRPSVGFIRRRDSRQTQGELRASPRPGWRLVRQFDARASLGYITTQANVLETRNRQVKLTTNFESGDAVSVQFDDQLESITAPFTLRSNVLIPPGTYRFDTVLLELTTFRRRHARLNLDFTTGGFWDGERDTLSISASHRMTTHVGVTGSYETNRVRLPDAEFQTHLTSARIQIAFRNDLALFSLLQYNSDTGELSTNLRLNWIPKPGSDFFIVYNELDDWMSAFGVRNRSLVVKLNYLFAL